MELVFRKLPPDFAAPAPGELLLRPAAQEQRQRRDLAMLVYEAGSDAFLAGPTPISRIVLPADPTLDDMLAASFLLRRLQGQSLPAGCKLFAQYAALVREGLRPTPFPLEQTLEGIFLAVLGSTDRDLTKPEAAQAMLESWSRLAGIVLQAAEQNQDPFAKPLFATGAEFARERAFLAKDLDVYRHDFSQGQAWFVRLPGGPARSLGLFLRRPKSLLFKYWSRGECPAPMGGPYLFLAVDWGKGQWVFSTDPVQKASLKPLADLLQQAEKKRAPAESEQDPWFDGKPFQHTLTASPRAGTKLADKTVLHIVKKWCRARPVVRQKWPIIAAALAVLIGLSAFGYFRFTQPSLLPVEDLYVLSIGVSKYQNLPSLSTPAGDAEAVAAAFKKIKGGMFKDVTAKVLTDDDAKRADIIDYGLSWLLREKVTSRSLVVITFAGHGLIEHATNQYHFAPADYESGNPGSTGLYLADLQRYVASLPCTVIVMFDTCHSGAAISEQDEPQELLKDIKKYVAGSGELFSRSRKSLVVVAACARQQLANENRRWGHGALTLSLLEGIDGKYHYEGKFQPDLPHRGPAGVVTMRELDRYLTERVEALSAEIDDPQNRRQAVNTTVAGSVALERIPIAYTKSGQ